MNYPAQLANLNIFVSKLGDIIMEHDIVNTIVVASDVHMAWFVLLAYLHTNPDK